VNILDRVIKRGLFTSGRSALLKVELLDKPGQLVQVSKIIADLGGNVIGVHHERTNANTGVTGCWIRIDLETRNFEHINNIKAALTKAGFKIMD
jgi:threonine dehydratase